MSEVQSVTRRVILFSKKDPASMTVKSALTENFGFTESDEVIFGNGVIRLGEVLGVTTNSEALFLSDAELRSLNSRLIVVAYRHRSEKGVNALLVHATGNWGSNSELGGLPNEVSYSMAGALRAALFTLLEESAANKSLEGWHVGFEATHHGPFSSTPLLFVEYGGTENALNDRDAAQAVASACISAVNAREAEIAHIGIGGSHYAPKFTKMSIEDRLAFGHIIPEYVFPTDLSMIRTAYDRVVEAKKLAVIDWKGLRGEHRRSVIEALERSGIEYVRS
ncbi:MAG: hypothetical protein NZ920_06170 [Aigarchaeota archaeon]|nr:hypothetical protein [Aigarchaeota archaeon]MDW8092692.1 D-aminoacyl-tRNA deacylase [Nitrososphaerota archaeon]